MAEELGNLDAERVIADPDDPRWFRAPTRRERWIAASLFVGFGLFFLLFSFVWAGSWVRWAIIGLAITSAYYGVSHAIVAGIGARDAKGARDDS